MWPVIEPHEALKLVLIGARGLDVRSEGEYNRGLLPHFRNRPILNNEHRHLVGLAYKQEGQTRAVELGHQLVGPIRDRMIAEWRQELDPLARDQRLLICWRGGMRSQIAAEWLDQIGVEGFRVAGGYKGLRRELMSVMDRPPPLLVLSGLTGSGKTEFLASLPDSRAVDLERAADHRGSAFGLPMGAEQPAQQTFENRVAFALWGRDEERVVEDEGVLIGLRALPRSLRLQMLRSPVLVLECSMEERVRRIHQEYVRQPLNVHPKGRVRQYLVDNLSRIERRLGGLRTREIRAALVEAFASAELNSPDPHRPWIESLLREYYDPAYEHAQVRHERPVLARGGARELHDFLTHRFGGRRP